MKCKKCEKEFNSLMNESGTGTTWALYICPHCKQAHAEGSYIPTQAINDPKIMCVGNQCHLGGLALSGEVRAEDNMAFGIKAKLTNTRVLLV